METDKKVLNTNKLRLINEYLRVPSDWQLTFADLGGVWGVDGAYTKYILDNAKVHHGWLVDLEISEKTRLMQREYGGKLDLWEGNFADEEVADKIGTVVDVVFMFDVLLHQAVPSWKQVLRMYASRTLCFVIHNPQMINRSLSVRLLDLGVETYFKNVPHTREEYPYESVVQKMYQPYPTDSRMIWRDIPHIWQWGITDPDLIAVMEDLGFEKTYFENCGRFGHLENFESHSFIFRKKVEAKSE